MKRQPRTPTRAAVEDGLLAVKAGDKEFIDPSVRATFADSLDLDAALQAEYPQDNRWDYLLGHQPSRSVVGIEPHSAKQREVSTVIAKRRAAQEHLRVHLKPGQRVATWLWVASGKVQFADTEKIRLRLDQEGVAFVGTRVLAKHLPASSGRTS